MKININYNNKIHTLDIENYNGYINIIGENYFDSFPIKLKYDEKIILPYSYQVKGVWKVGRIGLWLIASEYSEEIHIRAFEIDSKGNFDAPPMGYKLPFINI